MENQNDSFELSWFNCDWLPWDWLSVFITRKGWPHTWYSHKMVTMVLARVRERWTPSMDFDLILIYLWARVGSTPHRQFGSLPNHHHHQIIFLLLIYQKKLKQQEEGISSVSFYWRSLTLISCFLSRNTQWFKYSSIGSHWIGCIYLTNWEIFHGKKVGMAESV